MGRSELRPSRGRGRGSIDSILSGWGARPYDWQFGVSVQQELLPRVSVEVGYYRRWWPIFGAADITDNILTAPGDYTRFNVIAPSRSAAAERRRLHRAQHLQHHRGGECAAVTTTSRRRRTTSGRLHALLGWLRRHRAGTSQQRADAAGRHEHRTSGQRHLRAARERCRKAGRPTRTAVRSSRC